MGNEEATVPNPESPKHGYGCTTNLYDDQQSGQEENSKDQSRSEEQTNGEQHGDQHKLDGKDDHKLNGEDDNEKYEDDNIMDTTSYIIDWSLEVEEEERRELEKKEKEGIGDGCHNPGHQPDVLCQKKSEQPEQETDP